MSTFSERLRTERKRLKHSQTLFAQIGGITKQSQIAYEKDGVPQFANYLEFIAKAGADVEFIVTGKRKHVSLSAEEETLLALYRETSPAIRKAALAVLASGSTGNQNITVQGDVSGGSIVAHTVNKHG